MRAWALGVLAMLLLAGCSGTPGSSDDSPAATPTAIGDPLAVGNLTHAIDAFDMGQRAIDGGAAAPYLLHIRGETTVPMGGGPYPTVLLMHGRHGTCTTPVGERLLQPCPATPATASVESYTGYRYLAEHLASHGMAVVSMDANNVNDHDNDYRLAGDDYGATARANLIFEVLDEIAAGDAFADMRTKFDLDRVGLMGHSRGGEGVIRAATLAPERIDAIFALAPTDFARWVVPSSVAFATILPYCDGDVSTLHGAWVYDDMTGGTKHQFLHMGANHNFYNTVWTRDDWGNDPDPACGSAAEDRINADEQRSHGMALMGSFFRYYVGDQLDLWPLLEGSAPFDFDVKVSADFNVGHSRTPLLRNDGTSTFAKTNGTHPTRCTGSTCPIQETYSTASQLHLELEAGEHFEVITNGPFRSGSAMSFRIGLDQDASNASLQGLVMFAENLDGQRYEWRLADHGLFIPPGESAAKTTLNMIRLPYAPAMEAIGDGDIRGFGFYAYEPVAFQFLDWYELDAVPGGPMADRHY